MWVIWVIPMATNLIKNKHSLNFYDPYALEKNIKNLNSLGCVKIESLKNIPNNLDFIITMLPTGKEVKEVTIGNDGIVNYIKGNFIYIDMSTILPQDSKEIYYKLNKYGISMLDAPVARLVQNAIDATLLILVGGNKEDYDLSKSILSCMGSDVVYCGNSGSGSKMKIINNYMSILLNVITAETLALADSSGIDRDLAIKLMSTTAAGKGHMNLTYSC